MKNNFIEKNINSIIQGDCIEVLKEIPDESIDLVITDPPYNSRIEWDKKDNEFQMKWLKQIKRILKKGGSFYCFFSPLNMYEVEGFIRKEFTLKNIIIWWHRNLYGAGQTY